ncbi:MAG TPA: transketolase, partial [bacterium]|nr:transketolase [bacterium]
GVAHLFPKGHICNLHPWEANEVPVLLAEAFSGNFPIVCLHLTRPPVRTPDRTALGIPSHFEAARGAYVVRDYKKGKSPDGVIIARGTMSVYNLLGILPDLDNKFNLKIIIAASRELFDLQSAEYRRGVLTEGEFFDSMVVSNESRIATQSWIASPVNAEYALTSDWDNRWRTGGTLEQIIEESHLDPGHILEGISKFVEEKDIRRKRIKSV